MEDIILIGLFMIPNFVSAVRLIGAISAAGWRLKLADTCFCLRTVRFKILMARAHLLFPHLKNVT